MDPNRSCPEPDIDLLLRTVRYIASSLFRHRPDARQIAEHTSGDEFRAYGQKFFLSHPNSSRPYMSRATDTCNWAQIASEWERRGRFLFRSILYFGATPIINVLFFPSEVE
jgi:hypothetical protein